MLTDSDAERIACNNIHSLDDIAKILAHHLLRNTRSIAKEMVKDPMNDFDTRSQYAMSLVDAQALIKDCCISTFDMQGGDLFYETRRCIERYAKDYISK